MKWWYFCRFENIYVIILTIAEKLFHLTVSIVVMKKIFEFWFYTTSNKACWFNRSGINYDSFDLLLTWGFSWTSFGALHIICIICIPSIQIMILLHFRKFLSENFEHRSKNDSFGLHKFLCILLLILQTSQICFN